MKHFHDILVASGRDSTNPVVHEFSVDKGLITECGVYFPRGCNGIVRAKIFFQEHQILPRNQESWMHGTNGWWQGDLYFPVTAAPLTIKVIAWSYDDAFTAQAGYDHTITACLELTPFTMIPAWDKLIWLMTKMVQALGVYVPKPKVTEMTP